MGPVALLSLATALPPHRLEQDAVLARAEGLFGPRYPEFRRMAAVFRTSGISERRSVGERGWFDHPHGWPERNAAFLEGASALFVDAATRALEGCGLTAHEVDVVVTVTSTGIATPGLEAVVAGQMGFRPDIQRVPVFGLGCAGGASGLGIATRLAAAQPGKTVLFVAVETCTLSFRLDQLTKANMVATALFADGAAACVLRAGDADAPLAVIDGAAEHTWPDTLDVMGWRVDPEGLGVIFAVAIPPFAEANVGPAMSAMLADMGADRPDRFICHPGGTKVVQALERTLTLPDGSLDHERAVLADHGNMSSPTVLFVLERALAAGVRGRLVPMAMGPGFTCAALSLRVA